MFKSWIKLFAFSYGMSTIGKSMNPIIFSPAMGKMVGQTRLFNLGMTAGLEGKL